MGRKPLASKPQLGTPPSGGRVLPRAEVAPTVIASMSLERQPEIRSAINGLQPPAGIVNPAEVIVAPPEPEQTTKRKYKSTKDSLTSKLKKTKVPIRRSGRIQSTVMRRSNTDIAPLVADSNALTRRTLEKTRPREASLQENYLEGKVAYLSEAVEQLRTCFESLHSKFEKVEETRSHRTPGAETITGNSLEECQKKIEALVNENRELAKKLENAEMMHSKGNAAFGELLVKVRDIMLLFGPKATETAS